jgi:hypothetical protein
MKLIPSNHEVASKDARCVRFSCEKYCHTSQRCHWEGHRDTRWPTETES